MIKVLQTKEKMDISNTTSPWLILITASLFLWTAWTSSELLAKPSKKSPSNMAVVNVSKKIKEYEKRLEKLLAPMDYRYVAAGKPDPFRPFLQTDMNRVALEGKGKEKKPKRPNSCSTPLECMDVGQLTLVAVVTEPGGKGIAMAQDASGVGYILRPGTRIGFNKGKVVSIGRDKVVVREEVRDLRGKLVFRDRILYLHPEEGDESHR